MRATTQDERHTHKHNYAGQGEMLGPLSTLASFVSITQTNDE